MTKQPLELKIKVKDNSIEALPPGYEVVAWVKQEDGSSLYTVKTPGADDDQEVLYAMFGDFVDYKIVDIRPSN